MSVRNEEKGIVDRLSVVMLTKLALNRHKPMWTGETNDRLLKLARGNLSNLALSLYAGRAEDAVVDCADAANYLAMIADNVAARRPK